MTKAMKLLNKYEIDMIIKSDKTDFNNFYKDELVQMLERARSELQKQDDISERAMQYIKDHPCTSWYSGVMTKTGHIEIVRHQDVLLDILLGKR